MWNVWSSMSDSGTRARGWCVYFHDMIAFGETVLFHSHGLDQDAFVAHRLAYDATLRKYSSTTPISKGLISIT